MKTDLDSIMQTNNIDALLITGSAKHNPAMFYMIGGGHLTTADLVKKSGTSPVLFYNPMERDEAAKTGLTTKNLADYRLEKLIKQTGGDVEKAIVLRYQQMLTDLDLTEGRMAIYGKVDAGVAYAIFSALHQAMPDLTILGEVNDSTLLQAMATKDSAEIERIRQMGQITAAVIGQVADFLTSHRVENEMLVKPDGQPLTVGDVKRRINLWLAEREAENPEGTIFAIGRDAGIPHSSGTSTDVLRLGQTIVFDIFPCEAGGGYYYDITRTWCLGYAPDEAQALYEDVLSVYRQVVDELTVGTHCPDYQSRTCELFESQGHPTIGSDPQTEEGYVHSLGHGVGLNLHERPWFGRDATQSDILRPGSVFTVEPGLYYPERNMGVRLEDTVYINPDGEVDILVDYPLDLVLPIKS